MMYGCVLMLQAGVTVLPSLAHAVLTAAAIIHNAWL
jgi:hypothetical protein